MSRGLPGNESRPASLAGAAAEEVRSRRQAWRGEHAHMEGDLIRTVSLLEAIARVEEDVARTLRAMATVDGSPSAERRLRLAEEAVKGAHAAIERSEHLQRHAQTWQEHVEAVRLRQALERAGGLLADLARAENDIAGILTEMAAEDGTELAAQREKLANQALAGARRADARARALRELAAANTARPRSS